jgi:hypothetical protein
MQNATGRLKNINASMIKNPAAIHVMFMANPF